jgi:hypothetical protein
MPTHPTRHSFTSAGAAMDTTDQDGMNQGIPVLAEVQPDVTNFEGWTATSL